jgi:hypothetical protein
MTRRLILIPALCVGILVAYIDSRPNWDDTGITAFALLLSAAFLSAMVPESRWPIALSVGIWIPANAILQAHSFRSLAMFAVVAFPIAGAFLGALVRRAVTRS